MQNVSHPSYIIIIIRLIIHFKKKKTIYNFHQTSDTDITKQFDASNQNPFHKHLKKKKKKKEK